MRQIYYFFTVLLFIFANHAYSEESLSYAQQSEVNGVIAKQYFASYMDKNWNQLEQLLAEDGSFSDPTAEPVFGKVEHIGKQAVMKNFREGYASINYMRFNQSRVLLSGQYAIFEGTLDWSLSLANGKTAVTDAMPFVSIIKIENGLVIEHRDFAGYQKFIEAYEKAKGSE